MPPMSARNSIPLPTPHSRCRCTTLPDSSPSSECPLPVPRAVIDRPRLHTASVFVYISCSCRTPKVTYIVRTLNESCAHTSKISKAICCFSYNSCASGFVPEDLLPHPNCQVLQKRKTQRTLLSRAASPRQFHNKIVMHSLRAEPFTCRVLSAVSVCLCVG